MGASKQPKRVIHLRFVAGIGILSSKEYAVHLYFLTLAYKAMLISF